MASTFWAYAGAREEFLEPTWRCMSNNRRPTDHSADNLLLFSATDLVTLFGLARKETERTTEVRDMCAAAQSNLIRFVRACEIKPGLYLRYPGDDQGPTTFDDLIGLATASKLTSMPFAREIYSYAKWNGWKWATTPPAGPGIVEHLKAWADREYRIPLFPPTIRIANGVHPWPWEESGFVLAHEANYYEPKTESSGRCLLQLADWACYRSPIRLPGVDRAIEDHWHLMQARFPGGPRDLAEEYFKPGHPFALFWPRRFGPLWETSGS